LKIGIYWSILLLLLAGASKAEKKIRLSDVIETFDNVPVAFEESEERNKILQQLKLYQKFDSEFIAGCSKNQEKVYESPFCMLLNGPPHQTERQRKAKKRKIRRAILNELKQASKKKDLSGLSSYQESELSMALKSIHKAHWIDSLAKLANSSQSCPPSALSLALGLKLENRFPDPPTKNVTLSLYDRAFHCGTDAASIQAGYRLGLLRIWDGDCDQAEKVFSQIPDSAQNVDYRMRTAYWRLYCAGKKNDEPLRKQLKTWLMREYPLSLHGLLARLEAPENEFSFSVDQDPEVMFRSNLYPHLNSVTRAAEALLREGELVAASSLLYLNLDEVQKAELPFRLYWVSLLRKSRNIPSSFQLMASIFRENPELISKVTLELMYPLQQYQLIEGLNLPVDSYLILSLIRQESAFIANAKSPAGALGLMQLQLATARNFERVSKKQLYIPETNIRVGVKYFRKLMNSYNGEIELALAAYNAGPTRLKQWQKRYPIDNRLLFLDLLPLKETRDYVSSILKNYYLYLNLYAPQETGRRISGQNSSLMQSLKTSK
jgi:soluble lytic murein transglycosylase